MINSTMKHFTSYSVQPKDLLRAPDGSSGIFILSGAVKPQVTMNYFGGMASRLKRHVRQELKVITSIDARRPNPIEILCVTVIGDATPRMKRGRKVKE